jgi:hypothetical protein
MAVASWSSDVLVDGQRCRIFWGQGFRVPSKNNNNRHQTCTLMNAYRDWRDSVLLLLAE